LLQKLAASPWKQPKLADRHGQGTELIPCDQTRAPIPAQFEDQAKFMMFRYDGRLPLGGIRSGTCTTSCGSNPSSGASTTTAAEQSKTAERYRAVSPATAGPIAARTRVRTGDCGISAADVPQ